MIKLTFIGNYFVNKIPEFKNPNIEKRLEIKGVSPFSIVCGKKLEKYDNKVSELGEKVDIRKCLRELLSDKMSSVFHELVRCGGKSCLDANDSDYIVLDNTACIYDLINIENESFYTCNRHTVVTDNEYYLLNEREKKQRLIEVYKNPMFNWRYYFDFFIKLITERFPKEKIILISASHVEFYLSEGELKRYSEEDIKKIAFLNEVDQYFISKTQCKVINLLDGYLAIGYEKWKFPPARIETELGFKIREEIEKLVFENIHSDQWHYLNDLLLNYELWKAELNEEEKGKYFENEILRKYWERQNFFVEKNIEKLNSYGYCYEKNNENNSDAKLYIPLSSEWYLLVDSSNCQMEIIKCIQDFEMSKLKEDKFQCKLSQIIKILSSYHVYVEKARMGYGEKAFVINLTKQEFEESLRWLDYTYLLNNENVILNFTDGFKNCKINAPDIKCRVNLNFLFDKQTRIVRLGDGLGDQLALYFFAKTIEKQNNCNVYFDDTVYTYRRIFNGLEIQKIIKEDISSKLITNNLSDALIDRLQNCVSMDQYDYRLLYSLFYAGLKELVFIYMPTKDKIRNEFPGNKISLTPFDQEEHFFSNLADINFGIPYFSIIYRPPKVLIQNKDYWNSLIEFNDLDDDKNRKIICEIQNTDSVVIHIRRGDFEKQRRILKPEIYVNAVKKVKNIPEYVNKKFFIFSDDINWCSNNIESLGLKKGDDIAYISHNVGDDSWKDMVLMSYAKIMIVANSGFSLNAFIANKNVEILLGAYDFEKAGWKNKYSLVQEIRESAMQQNNNEIDSAVRENRPEPQDEKFENNREDIEWLNFWYDKGNETRTDRILLIGDSITRDYRKPLAQLTKRPIDFFAGSADICDDYFWKSLDLFFSYEEYRQEKAHIQIGLHGIDGVNRAIRYNNIDEWERNYEKLVIYILKYIPNVTIALTTPVVQKSDLSVIDEGITNEIIKRNSVAKKVAEKYKLEVNDLYALMVGQPHRDWAHFSEEGNERIARQVAKMLDLHM